MTVGRCLVGLEKTRGRIKGRTVGDENACAVERQARGPNLPARTVAEKPPTQIHSVARTNVLARWRHDRPLTQAV